MKSMRSYISQNKLLLYKICIWTIYLLDWINSKMSRIQFNFVFIFYLFLSSRVQSTPGMKFSCIIWVILKFNAMFHLDQLGWGFVILYTYGKHIHKTYPLLMFIIIGWRLDLFYSFKFFKHIHNRYYFNISCF